jgi:hypothetical protein
MKTITVPLSEILSIISCAEDYGHSNQVLMSALAEWCGNKPTAEDIDEYANFIASMEDYGQEDAESIKESLNRWKNTYF